MALYALDTDIYSLFRHGDPRVSTQILRHAADELAVTVITVEESLSGWYTLLRRAKSPDRIAHAYSRLADTVHALADFRILSFSESAIVRFEDLRAAHRRIKGNDLRIASTVLEYGVTLVTRNLADFAGIPGLVTVDWSA